MFADLVPQPRTLARAALTVAYLGLMLVMTVVAWEGGKVDLSSVGQVFGALGAGLLGAVINPSTSKKPAPPSGAGGSGSSGGSGGSGGAASSGSVGSLVSVFNGERETDAFWAIQTVVGAGALLLTALALAVNGTGHANAPDAFVAVAAAFGALFVDTSSVTHPLTDATTATPDAGGTGDGGSAIAAPASEAAAPATAAAPAPATPVTPADAAAEAPTGAAAPTGKAHIPAQSTGSADDAESPNN